MTDDPIKVTLFVLPQNYRRLELTAAVNAESFTDAANRAFALYEVLHTTPVGKTVFWNDGYRQRKIVILE